jgi:hypothetical protein
MSRRAPALLLTLALAACGGSGSTKDTAPTKEAATAAAAAINLQEADAPTGFVGKPHDATGDNSAQDKALVACIGATPPGSEVADVYGADLSKGAALPQYMASTQVSVLPSKAIVQKDLAAFQDKTKTTGCLTAGLTKLVNEQGKSAGGLTADGVKVEAVDEKSDGTDGAFSYRFNATLKASGLTVPVEITLTGVLVKHSELQFTTIGIGDVFPADVRAQLLKKAVDRLKKSAV